MSNKFWYDPCDSSWVKQTKRTVTFKVEYINGKGDAIKGNVTRKKR